MSTWAGYALCFIAGMFAGFIAGYISNDNQWRKR